MSKISGEKKYEAGSKRLLLTLDGEALVAVVGNWSDPLVQAAQRIATGAQSVPIR